MVVNKAVNRGEMIFADILFKSFYVYLTKFGTRGKQAALIPLSMSMSCILIFISSYLFSLAGSSFFDTVSFLGFVISAVLFYILSMKLFEFVYIKKEREVNFSSFGLIYYLIGFVLLFGGSFLLVYSFKYA